MTEATSRLRVDGVSMRFGAVDALRSVDIDVRPGRVLAVLGRNASGKSTLLRVMAGVLEPTAGTVSLEGRSLATWPRATRVRRLGYLAQQPQVVGGFTVAETVAFGGHASGGVAESTIASALGDVGLASLAGRSFRDLSVGQRQRAALARVLVQVASDGVMVLDEPFAAQDPGEVDRLIGVVRVRAAEGRAVVAAVHDASVAHAIADDVLLLDEGRRVFAGPAADGLASDRLAGLFGVAFADGPAGPTPRFGLGLA